MSLLCRLQLQQKALKLLARREHSRKELTQKLSPLKPSSDELDALFLFLSDNGYQSDLRYARFLIKTRIQQKFGPIRIEMELLQKGISRSLISKELAKFSCSWCTIAESALYKKFHSFETENKMLGRYLNYLIYKGFSYEIANKVVQSILKVENICDHHHNCEH